MADEIPSPVPAEWDERLRGLAALLPLFDGPGVEPAAAIEALNEAAYRLGWVLSNFDWPTWAHGPECQALVRDPATVASAEPLTLARLLTAFEGGHLAAIVRRADAIVG